MRRTATEAIILFVALALAAALLFAGSVIADAFARAVLIQMGCVVFGAGLTVFLLRLLSTTDHA